MTAAIRIEKLGKRYQVKQGEEGSSYRTLRESLSDWVRAPFRRPRKKNNQVPFWALQDVSFEVQPGEVVGIIGHNGAGKSTLLKILSRITKPTQGRVHLKGRVGSLLEVGTGFHPELTGRENIYLNGSILGMSRKEIERRFDEIVAFAEVEKFLDTPVKRYSSGMYVRLAFAVAAHLEPEILLVDEVLAVGDVAFQNKCLGKMRQVGGEGRTILFVSHNLPALQVLCDRAVLFARGRVVADAPVAETVGMYLRSVEERAQAEVSQRTDRAGAGRSRLMRLEVHNGEDGCSGPLQMGGPCRFTFHVDRLAPGLMCVFNIVDEFGQGVTKINSNYRSQEDFMDPESNSRLVCIIDPLLLAPGRYRVDVGLYASRELQDQIEGAAFFEVIRGVACGREVPRSRGDWKFVLPHRWILPHDLG
jgi:lipopolysaccharide transport system ATP-binding protein